MTRRKHRRTTRTTGAVTMAAAMVVAAVLAGSTVLSTRSSEAQVDRSPGPSASLVDQTTWVDPDGEVVVRFRLDGFPPDATVEATLHERIAHRADFELTVEGDQLRGRLTDPPIQLGTVAELGADDGREIVARIPIRSGPQEPDEPERLPIFAAGVHPVDIAVHDTDRTRLGGFVTHVVRLPLDVGGPEDPDHRIGLVVAVGLDADPARSPGGTVTLDDTTKGIWTAAAIGLAAAADLPVVLAPQPEHLEALATGESALDRRLVGDLAEIASVGLVPAMAYVPLDLDAMVDAGLDTEVDHQLDLGERALRSQLGVDVESRLWLGDDRLTGGDLTALSAQGIEHLVVPHSVLEEPPDDPFLPFLVETTEGDRLTALTTDRLLQDHLDQRGDPRLGAQHLLADLALAWFTAETDQAAVIVVGPSHLDPVFFETLDRGIASSPLLEGVTPNDAISRATATAGADPSGDLPVLDLVRDHSDTDLSQLRLDLDLVRLSIETFSSVFPESDDLIGRFEELLAVLPFREFDDQDRGAYYLTIAEEIETRLDAIGLPERRAITLPARDGTIPLTLTNASDRPAVVAVHFDSDRLDFPAGDRIEVTIPEGTRTVDIDVQVRTSGAFPLEVLVESPDGRVELAAARYTIRSTAVSGVGIALSVVAVLVLAVWWTRTARRARAAHREDTHAT